MHIDHHPSRPTPNGTIAMMDCLSPQTRLAALDTAAAAAATAYAQPLCLSSPPHDNDAAVTTATAPSSSCYPVPFPSLPPMPATHQIVASVPTNKNFPETLWHVISAEEHADVVSWLPHGRAFTIPDKRLFTEAILPLYFDGAKWTSFTRRLKRWNFVRVSKGREAGAYYNENFVRGRLELVDRMGYQMEGRFRIGKRKKSRDEKNDAQAQIQERSSKKEARQEDSLPRPTNHLPRQVLPLIPNHPAIKAMYFTDPQDWLRAQNPPPTLPNTLQKSPNAVAKTESSRSFAVSDTLMNRLTPDSEFSEHPKLVSVKKNPATSCGLAPSETLVYPPPPPPVATFGEHPGCIPELMWPTQHWMERQPYLPPVLPTLSHEHSSGAYPVSNAERPPMGGDRHYPFHHPSYALAPAAQNTFSAERAEHIIGPVPHHPHQHNIISTNVHPNQDPMSCYNSFAGASPQSDLYSNETSFETRQMYGEAHREGGGGQPTPMSHVQEEWELDIVDIQGPSLAY